MLLVVPAGQFGPEPPVPPSALLPLAHHPPAYALHPSATAGKYNTSNLPSDVAIGVLVVICVFVAGFAWSWGPLGWLVPSEIQVGAGACTDLG